MKIIKILKINNKMKFSKNNQKQINLFSQIKMIIMNKNKI